MSDRHRISRRQFVKGASAAIAAPYFLTSSALGAGGRSKANERINVCCIGMRNRGNKIIRSVLGDRRTQVVAICDVDDPIGQKAKNRVEKHYGGDHKCDLVRDYREICARDDIDAVVIATPDHTHAVISVAAMKSGKDVFCEKPMTLTIHDGRVMSDTARRYGRVFQVGSQRRSQGGYHRMAELVRNGRIGQVKEVYIGVSCGRPGGSPAYNVRPVPDHFDYNLWLGPAPWEPYDPSRCHYKFRFVRAYSGGEMTNWGAHYLDVVQMVLGKDDTGPVEVKPIAGWRHKSGIYDVFRDFKFDFTYADGTVVHVNQGGTRFIGTEGTLYNEGKSDPGSIVKSKIRPEEFHYPQTHGNHMSEFFHGVLTRQPTTAPVEAGHRSTTVCHLANIALELDRPVKWDPEKEEFPDDEEANRLRRRPYREPFSL